MQAHKLVLLVLDFEGYGPEQIEMMASNARGLDPSVMSIETRDIGEWTDDHPLNKQGTAEAEFDRLFAPVSTPQQSAQRASVDTLDFDRLLRTFVNALNGSEQEHVAARAALIAHINAWGSAGSGAIPEGWQIVPPQPTEEMHVAAVRAIVRATGNDDFPPAVWAAMLAAAPSPAPQGEQA